MVKSANYFCKRLKIIYNISSLFDFFNPCVCLPDLISLWFLKFLLHLPLVFIFKKFFR